MNRSIHIEAYYDASVQEVWEALTDPESLSDWLMDNDFAPKVGHRFQFRTKPNPMWNGEVDCEVLEVDPPRRLRYTWCNAKNRVDTVVSWTLQRDGTGTRLILDHTGFAGIRAVLVSELLRRGWKSNVLGRRLPEVLARRARSSNEAHA
jgi:uncharacterized protein YndB with AHSA1/START domain